MPEPLTKKQKGVLDFVKSFQKKKGYSPTHGEIGKKFGLSVSSVNQYLATLKEKGHIQKDKGRARSIELSESVPMVEIPLSGTIAAGAPIEAIEVPETITVAMNDIGKFGNHYALRVQGNSMIDDGIYDGDIVIIRQQSIADNGQTVVAIINDNEATLKRIYREKDRFRLQPANPTLFPIYAEEVEIRGVVVKIIRNIEKPLEEEKISNHKFQRQIDYSWNFERVNTKPHTHGFHTYPAMFIPHVARRLLLTYSKKGDTICDIFCGSGTALIESRLLGRNAYGIDLNPLAVFLAETKTTPINSKILHKEYLKLLKRAGEIKNHQITKPVFNNIDFWFKDKVIIELAKIKKAIKDISNKNIRKFFMVAFSETVRKVSNTKSGEFKLVRIKGDSLKNYNPDVLNVFRKKTELNIKGMESYYADVDKKTRVNIIYGDSSKDNGIKNESVDFIVTSPPYGDSRTTVAYGQFSRLSAQWIDIFDNPNDASGVDNELLGGKPVNELKNSLGSFYLKDSLEKISTKDPKRAKDVLSFYIGLNECLKKAYQILKQNKYFCLVIGNRLVKQVRIPTDFIIAELAENIGFNCENIVVRNIPGKRMPIKNCPTNIAGELEETMTKESIVVLRKN